MPKDQRTPLGPTGETVRHNIRRLRDERRLSVPELAARLQANGHAVPVIALRRIEAGERRVDADELVAIAFALGVTPNMLLIPPATATADNSTVAASGGPENLTAEQAWEWASGVQLPPGVGDEVARALFEFNARQARERKNQQEGET